MTLRVLQLIETGGPGGAETVFASLAEALTRRGHAVRCMTGDGSWLPQELARRQLPHELLAFHGAFDRALFMQIRRALRQHRIDVVHAHLFDGAVYAAAAARSLGVPCVVTLHGQVDVRSAGWKGSLKRQLLGRCASRVVAVSGALKRDLAATFGMHATSFDVIHNGIEPNDVAPSPSDTPRTQIASGTPDTPLRLLAVGNIRAPKGYPFLLEAVAILQRRGFTVQLDIIGEPDKEGLFEALQQQVRSLGIGQAVRFLGFVPRPAAAIAASDALIVASTKEGFSLVAIEAMQLGTPVVATRSGGPEEILADGETGFLVAAGDAAALADGIVRALADPVATGRVVDGARLDAMSRFSLDAMVDRYVALYRHLMQRDG